MSALGGLSAVVEWSARLAGPAAVWGFGVAGIVTALGLVDQSRSLAAVVAASGLVLTATGLHLAARAVHRLRHGPPAPPGEGL